VNTGRHRAALDAALGPKSKPPGKGTRR
jgi:hypothetical protein